MHKAWAVKVHAFYEKADIYDCADVGKRKELINEKNRLCFQNNRMLSKT